MTEIVQPPREAQIINVWLLRKAIGVLGIALPVVLLAGGWLGGVETQQSMSAYYRTQMHDVFVGVLCAIGLGLFAYKGYRSEEHPRRENWAGNWAAGLAVGTALLAPGSESKLIALCEVIPLLKIGLNNLLHHVCAIGLIVILAWFAWQFSKGRLKRFYRGCSVWILAWGVFAGIHAVGAGFVPNGVFWGEAFAVWGFGFAWFVKGRK